MSNVYRIHGARFLRKYTAAEKSSNYAYMADVRKIADSLCKVPWTRVVGDVAATTTIHTEEGLDWNEPERDRFDAAEWCGEHSDGFHRAFAQAACYVFKLPTTAIGKTIQKISVNVTSDPYNPYGARIAALTSTTLNIPMDCDTVRGGDVHRAPDSDGMGAAPRLFKVNADGTQTWYANSEIVELVPGATLAAKQYLFVFVSLENYNRGRDGWIEGSSYIDNDVELTLSSAATDLDANELNDLTPPVVLSEFNVCRGEVLPSLIGEVSGIQVVDVKLDGRTSESLDDFVERPGDNGTLDDSAAIGLRTAYGLFYTGAAKQIATSECGLSTKVRPGAAFSVSVRRLTGEAYSATSQTSWQNSNVSKGYWKSIAFGGSTFVACPGYFTAQGVTMDTGLWRSTDGGRSWSKSYKTDGNWDAVAFGNGVFVAGGYIGTNGSLWYSEGGLSWTKGDLDTSGTQFRSIAFGRGVFVAGSNNGFYYSNNGGRNWTHCEMSAFDVDKIAFGDGVFLASGFGDGEFKILKSTDGIHWERCVSDFAHGICASNVFYGNGIFIATGWERVSDSYSLWLSTDNGVTWRKSGMTTDGAYSVVYANGVFYAALYNGGVSYSSDNGMTWQTFYQTSSKFRSIAFGNDVLVIGCDVGTAGIKYREIPFAYSVCWKILSSVIFARTAVPIDFHATKVRLDWSDWTGAATSGSRFNVWMKRGSFSGEYPADVVKNHAIYDCESAEVDGYELVGTIDATLSSRTATLDLKRPLVGEVATFLLSAYASMDSVNPASGMTLPVGVAKNQYFNSVNKVLNGIETGWRPDITLLG